MKFLWRSKTMIQSLNLIVSSKEEARQIILNNIDKIVNLIKNRCYFYCTKYSRYIENHGDLAQDVVLYILQKIDVYNCINTIYAFINGIIDQQIRNALAKVCIDFKNRKRFLQENLHLGNNKSVIFGLRQNCESPVDLASKNEIFDLFFNDSEIDYFDKMTMKLFCEGGKNYVEIATELNCSVMKVYNSIDKLGKKYETKFRKCTS